MTRLVDYLTERCGDDRFLFATITTRDADPIIIASGAEVMPIGGFSGADPIVTPEGFAEAVARHQVRFVLFRPTRGYYAGLERRQPVLAWMRANGTAVDPELWHDPDERGHKVLYDLRPGE